MKQKKNTELIINTKNHTEQCMESVEIVVKAKVKGLREQIQHKNIIQIRVDNEYISFIASSHADLYGLSPLMAMPCSRYLDLPIKE